MLLHISLARIDQCPDFIIDSNFIWKIGKKWQTIHVGPVIMQGNVNMSLEINLEIVKSLRGYFILFKYIR